MDKKENLISKAVKDICFQFNYKAIDLQSKNRFPENVRQRTSAMYILYHFYGFSYSEIGRFFNKNHSTVIHAIKKIKKESIPSFEKLQPFPVANKIKGINNHSSRQKFVDLYQGKCAICGFEDIIEVHHIIPLRQGGSNTPQNTIVLCPNHHTMLHLGLLKIKDIRTIQKLPIDLKTGVN